jgi:hypothetical protein
MLNVAHIRHLSVWIPTKSKGRDISLSVDPAIPRAGLRLAPVLYPSEREVNTRLRDTGLLRDFVLEVLLGVASHDEQAPPASCSF